MVGCDKRPWNEHDATIVGAIIDVAHLLGLTVVAEGVESKEQLDLLTAMHGHIVRGFYFGTSPLAQVQKSPHHHQSREKQSSSGAGKHLILTPLRAEISGPATATFFG